LWYAVSDFSSLQVKPEKGWYEKYSWYGKGKEAGDEHLKKSPEMPTEYLWGLRGQKKGKGMFSLAF
jgi:hypothetical protein